MIHTTKDFCVRELPLLTSSSAGTKRSAPKTATNDQVLTDLFQARMGPVSSAIHHHHDNEETTTQRATPLATIGDSSSLFPLSSRVKSPLETPLEQPCGSLFRQLVHTKRFKPSSIDECCKKPDLSFLSQTSLFPLAMSPSTTTSKPTTTQSVDDALMIGQSLQSLSSALLITQQTTATPTPAPTMKLNRKKRPLRNQATRMRLVGQVVGPRGVQRLISLVKELQQLREAGTIKADNSNNFALVDAWEGTPLNDLKSQPWEELMKLSEELLKASSSNKGI